MGLAPVVVVVDSVVEDEGLAAGAAVSVFCSQAARSAAPAMMQMYFFIGWRSFKEDSWQESVLAVRFIAPPHILSRAPRRQHGRSISHRAY